MSPAHLSPAHLSAARLPDSRRFAWSTIRRLLFALVACGILGLTPREDARGADPWPEFRGPRGDGRADTSDVPVEFGEGKRQAWKVAIHGKGWSSPVVWGNQIWLTTATEDGKQMSVLCIDRQTGKILHDRVLFENATPAFCHPTNSYASPTSAIEEGRVYVHFGSYGTACLDTKTFSTIWERRDLPCDHWRGPGSSLTLHDGVLYVPYDGHDLQYVAAFDKQTGELRWKSERGIRYESEDGDIKKAYSTCQVIEVAGQRQLVCPSAAETIAYEPESGREIWRLRHGGMNAATRPLFADGLLYLTVGDAVGDARPALLAVRLDSSAGKTVPQLAWKLDKSPPKRPSPIVVNGLVFVINDDGVASCLDTATGQTHWHHRIAGTYRASPVYASGRIYFCSLEGTVTVVAAEKTYRELAVNQFDQGFQASPALHGNALILRSLTDLHCFE